MAWHGRSPRWTRSSNQRPAASFQEGPRQPKKICPLIIHSTSTRTALIRDSKLVAGSWGLDATSAASYSSPSSRSWDTNSDRDMPISTADPSMTAISGAAR